MVNEKCNLRRFLIDEYELVLEGFVSLLNALTEEEDLRTFMLTPEIRLESRLRRYLLHANHSIRCSVVQVIRHLMFDHENKFLSERFCTFKQDEAHVGSSDN